MIKWNKDLLEDFMRGYHSDPLKLRTTCRIVGTLVGFGNMQPEREDSKLSRKSEKRNQTKACVSGISWLFSWILWSGRTSKTSLGISVMGVFVDIRHFLPKVILSQWFQFSTVLCMAAHFQRKRMVRILFHPNFYLLWVSGRLCVDPDTGRDDPRDGPWLRSAGSIGRWLCDI